MKFLEPWAGITACIRKDQIELRKKKDRTLLGPASSSSIFWHMKEACKTERVFSVSGRCHICWRMEVKVAPQSPRVALNSQQRLSSRLLALQASSSSFRRFSSKFSLQDLTIWRQVSLAKIPSFPFYKDLMTTQYAILASTLGSWWCPENSNQHLKVGWWKGHEWKGHRALDENHNSTTYCSDNNSLSYRLIPVK